MRGNMFSSTIGRKLAMAVSGAGIIVFVIGHIAGNLQIFLGQEPLNAYAKFLKDSPEILWPARIGLIAIFLIHIVAAFQLKARNMSARPTGYKYDSTVQASAASRYMLQSGIVVLIFVVIHLLHFTLGVTDPEIYNVHDAKGRHDVYTMIILGFQNDYYALGYIACMVALGAHLSHALSSALQTLGLRHPAYAKQIKMAAPLLAWAIAFAYISIPLSVMLGILTPPVG